MCRNIPPLIRRICSKCSVPVLKAKGFGEAVNITLGLPIIRTSVDHGTALNLAGTGQAKVGSLLAALKMAAEMAYD